MKPTLEEIGGECASFRDSFSTLVLGTANGEGLPEASYAPFVLEPDGSMFVYVSDLSRHTANLRESGLASVLMIENEGDAQHLFARRRLTMQCDCELVGRDDDRWGEVLDRFKARFGDLVDVLREMQDFHLFRLAPRSGTYVRGFAQAYELSGPELGEIRHIRDQGHTSSRQQAETAGEE